MFSKQIKLLFFLAVLPPTFLGSPHAQTPQLDANVRGNSFGLENFLFQPYENGEVRDAVRVVKSKRPRPRITSSDRGQTYGLENLSAHVYESGRVKPTQEQAKRRPGVEPTPESNRIKENFVVKPETVAEATREPETTTKEVVTERIRKRIMMRRRRKRPSNAETQSEVTGNAILKPVRIPVYPQVPKVGIRTKPPEENTLNRQQIGGEATAGETQNDDLQGMKETTGTAIVTEKSTFIATTEKPSAINLKTFLKQQTETLSLSELLQTQNLSLADLLRGNKDASAILKARQSIVSTTTATNVRRKQFNTKTESDKIETPPKKLLGVEVTTSRPTYNGFQPKIPRTKTNEQTNGKPVEETQKQDRRPTYSSGFDPQNRLTELRLKLRNFQKKTPEVISAPPHQDETIETASGAIKTTEPSYQKNRIPFKSANNPELSLILPSKIKPETEKRPERFSNWTSRLPSIKRFGQDKSKQNDAMVKPLTVPSLAQDEPKSSEAVEVPETTPKVEEIRKPEPKDELIELLKSGQNADRLQKILQSRNMTIQELLDNREKPPLQMNISKLFSEQKHVPATTPQPTLFDSLPDFDLQETDGYDEPEAEESAPTIAKVMPSREPKQYEFPVSEGGVSQLNLQPDDPTPDTSTAEDSLWKLSEKSIYYGSSYGYGDFPSIQQTEKPKTVKPELPDSDIVLLETIRRGQDTSRKFKLNLNEFPREEEEPQPEDIEKSYIPPAVKSAIIASGVVMGIALFVFIAIFAACGWKQRQIRLKSSSGGTLTKEQKSNRTLSPVSFKDGHSYKKTMDFDETSESGASNTSSYLWNTLKNTFTSRASTLKSRLEKEEKLREDKVTLRRNESRRKESRFDDRPMGDDVHTVKKIDRDRNVINTSFNFKRSPSNNNVGHFNECVHGY